MPQSRPVLLLTRPRPDAVAFGKEFRDRFDVVISPLVEIVSLADRIDWRGARSVIFTSRNGVRVASGLDPNRTRPAFCVGMRTTDAARSQGWPATCAGETADALVETLTTTPPPLPALHLRGRHARGEIAERLTLQGLQTVESVVYDQRHCPLSDEAAALIASERRVIVPLFSPRTATQFVACSAPRAGLFVLALSKAVAEPLEKAGFGPVSCAERPTADAMRDAIDGWSTSPGRVEGAPAAQ